MQLSQNDWLAIEKELCKRSLVEFVKQAWHVIEPGQKYLHGWHVDAICEHLEAVTHGDINRLLINVPPGTMKSTLTGIFWPAWEWGPQGKPNHRFIGASHSEALAIRDNRRMRQLVESEWYQKRWPTKFVHDQNEKKYFENQATGWRQACAVKAMTGRRGDCLHGDVLISTDTGEIPISEIVNHAKKCNVLSYCENSRRLVYKQVKAVARCAADEIYRIHTSDGVVVECTRDHRFYTARGYVQAHLLSANDVLLQVLQRKHGEKCLSNEKTREERAQRDILQPVLLHEASKRNCGKEGNFLLGLQYKNSKRKEAMLTGMQRNCSGEKGQEKAGFIASDSLRNLQQRDRTKNQVIHEKILLKEMREFCALNSNEENKQPDVARWSGREKIRSSKFEAIQENQAGYFRSGQKFVRLLQCEKKPLRASHGHGHIEQHMEKSGHSLPSLSCNVAQQAKIEAGNCSVVLVERVSRSEVVYDLQVEGTQCFFANGILVHNCVLWDDPHSVEAALSVAEREEALRVFQETLPTRLNNPDSSAIIIVMQRLHENDVSGYILENDLGYTHLCLPMEFEPERKCITSIGFEDPRKEDGELLFPARFSRETVERDKKVMGPMAVAGQLQQRPAPRTGGFFEWDRIEIVDAIPAKVKQTVRYWDKAGTDGAGAHTAGVLMSSCDDGCFYIQDVVRGQWAASKRESVIKSTANLDGRIVTIWIEQEPGSGGKESAESTIKNLAGFKIKSERPTGDKAVRAEPYSVQVAAGNVKLVRGEWNQAFIDEHKTFPVGKYKDQVDAAGGAFNKLATINTNHLFGL